MTVARLVLTLMRDSFYKFENKINLCVQMFSVFGDFHTSGTRFTHTPVCVCKFKNIVKLCVALV